MHTLIELDLVNFILQFESIGDKWLGWSGK